jgi:DNA replicative helicase MCM subunit Mcm2 (Cdc46/Mcm family)
MKNLKRELQSVLKGLNSLAQKAEKIAEKLDKLETVQVPKTSKARTGVKAKTERVAKRSAKATAIDTVFDIIKRSRKGADTTALKHKTGFDDKKIWNIINRLKQQKRIKSERKGVYVKI